jgi:hypothetical protein
MALARQRRPGPSPSTHETSRHRISPSPPLRVFRPFDRRPCPGTRNAKPAVSVDGPFPTARGFKPNIAYSTPRFELRRGAGTGAQPQRPTSVGEVAAGEAKGGVAAILSACRAMSGFAGRLALSGWSPQGSCECHRSHAQGDERGRQYGALVPALLDPQKGDVLFSSFADGCCQLLHHRPMRVVRYECG